MEVDNFKDALKQVKKNMVTSLDVGSQTHYHKLNPEHAIDLAKVLGSNTVLTSLSMNGHHLGGSEYADYGEKAPTEGIKALMQALTSHPALKELELLNNYIHGENGEDVGEMLKHNQVLNILALSDNYGFSDPGVRYIANALKHNQTLTHLYLGGCGLGERDYNRGQDAGKALGSMLKSNHTLRHLVLGGGRDIFSNRLSTEGAAALIKGLAENTGLRYLDLENTHLSYAHAVDLIHAINNQQTLSHLDLSNNIMEDGNGEEFAKALANNQSLVQLNLLGNKFGDDAVKKIAQALSNHPCLESLSIDASNEVSQEIVEMLVSCPNLATLDFRQEFRFHEKLEEQFKKARHKNLVYFFNDGSQGYVCNGTFKKAKELIKLMRDAPEDLTKEDIAEISERAPAIRAVAERYFELDEKQITELFSAVEAQAASQHVAFSSAQKNGKARIPMNVPEAIDETPVDMSVVTSLADLRKPVEAKKLHYASVLGQLVRDGRFDEVKELLAAKHEKLTADDYLLQESAHHPTLIQMLSEQERLAEVFIIAEWKHDLDGLKKLLGVVDAKAFERQLGQTPEAFISHVDLIKIVEKRDKFARPDDLGRSWATGR